LVRDAHATYGVEDIAAEVVSRVAEHALGDQLELVESSAVAFVTPPQRQSSPAGADSGRGRRQALLAAQRLAVKLKNRG
jgi:hypothetical protein